MMNVKINTYFLAWLHTAVFEHAVSIRLPEEAGLLQVYLKDVIKY